LQRWWKQFSSLCKASRNCLDKPSFIQKGANKTFVSQSNFPHAVSLTPGVMLTALGYSFSLQCWLQAAVLFT
jgi:hypothetical protein